MASKPKFTKMTDVAASSAVSISTVSRVLNGDRNVSVNARQRVLEVIDRLGYRPLRRPKRSKRAVVDSKQDSANNIAFLTHQFHADFQRFGAAFSSASRVCIKSGVGLEMQLIQDLDRAATNAKDASDPSSERHLSSFAGILAVNIGEDRRLKAAIERQPRGCHPRPRGIRLLF